jgi:hypothetical protein
MGSLILPSIHHGQLAWKDRAGQAYDQAKDQAKDTAHAAAERTGQAYEGARGQGQPSP